MTPPPRRIETSVGPDHAEGALSPTVLPKGLRRVPKGVDALAT